MRRLIQAAAIATALAPSVAFAHGGVDEPTPGGNAGTSETGGQQVGTAEEGDPGDRAGGAAERERARLAAEHSQTRRLPFRNSILILDQSVTPETIFPGTQLSPLPSYQWWLSFRPRWYLTNDLSVRARIDLTTEWTNNSDTTLERDPQWGDIWTELVYSGYPTVAGIKFSTGLRAVWPLSLTSQARGTYVTLGLTAGANRAFEHMPGGGDLTVGVSFAGSHPFTQYTSGVGTSSTYGCMVADASTPQTCGYLGGSEGAAFTLLSIFTLGYNTPLHGLSINLFYLLSNTWAYNTADATVPTMTSTTNGTTTNDAFVPRSATDTRMRQAEWFLASVDYEVTRWASLSLGYYVFHPVLDPDGSYGNPFFSPGGNTRIFFSLTVPLDGLYDALTGAPVPPTSTHASNGSPTRTGPNAIARDVRMQQLMNGTF